jgi:uncharacterized protein
MQVSLAAFLADQRRPAGTLSYHELQGFLFAVVSAPELIAPSEWMPLVFGDKQAGYESLEEAQAIMQELMALYNAINDGARGAATLPANCTFRDDVLDNLEPDAPINQWSRGFALGHQWLEDTWSECVPEEHDDEFGVIVLALSFFSSRRLAEAYRKELAPGSSLSDTAKMILEIFPESLSEYARIGRTIAAVLAEHAAGPQPVRRESRTGRNDPCPCGSGRKFKKCCGATPLSSQ